MVAKDKQMRHFQNKKAFCKKSFIIRERVLFVKKSSFSESWLNRTKKNYIFIKKTLYFILYFILYIG